MGFWKIDTLTVKHHYGSRPTVSSLILPILITAAVIAFLVRGTRIKDKAGINIYAASCPRCRTTGLLPTLYLV